MRLFAGTVFLVASIALVAAFRPNASRYDAVSPGAREVLRKSPTPVLTAKAEDEASPAAHEEAVERFAVATDGSPLIIPVNVEGREYPFVVDTGFSCTLLDASFRSQLRPTEATMNLNGRNSYRLYEAPEMTVGQSRMPVRGPVLCHDLAELQGKAGLDFQGILGMSFLGFHVVEIDLDEGTLAFHKTTPRRTGTRLQLSYDRRRLPTIDVWIDMGDGVDVVAKPVPFLVDTGCALSIAGGIEERLFDELIRRRKLTLINETFPSWVFEGTVKKAYGRLKRFPIGENVHERQYFSRSDENLLGLAYLSRYIVTLDFPHHAIVLTPGRKFGLPSAFDVTGLSLTKREEQTIVDEVRTESIAKKAGFRVGDRVVEIDGKSVDRSYLFVVESRLSSYERPIELAIERGGTVQRIELAR